MIIGTTCNSNMVPSFWREICAATSNAASELSSKSTGHRILLNGKDIYGLLNADHIIPLSGYHCRIVITGHAATLTTRSAMLPKKRVRSPDAHVCPSRLDRRVMPPALRLPGTVKLSRAFLQAILVQRNRRA